MKIVLILVLLNISGNEIITADFDDVEACEHAALRTFQGLQEEVEIEPLEPIEGAELLEGTMIATAGDGMQLGVFSCNPAGAGQSDR